jgi:hypothetical protein
VDRQYCWVCPTWINVRNAIQQCHDTEEVEAKYKTAKGKVRPRVPITPEVILLCLCSQEHINKKDDHGGNVDNIEIGFGLVLEVPLD